MKRTQLLFILAAFAFSFIVQQANAKVWRVNNLSNYDVTKSLWGDNLGGSPSNPVFAQLTNVNTSNLVSAGTIDTLHLEGTNSVYNSVELTKKVVIIGPGYFLGDNPNVSNNIMESEIGYIYFRPGSDGSQLIGVHVSSVYGISIFSNDIIIKRCRIDHGVSVSYDITDITIVQNYFSNIPSNNSSAIDVTPYGFPSNFVFNNNICRKTFILSSGTTVYNAQECNNNVFDCPAISNAPSLKFNAAVCRNNILRSDGVNVEVNGSNNPQFTNNTSAPNSALLGTDPTNIHAVNINTLFVSSESSDGRYMLNLSSPDNRPGYNGTQRGVFGGITAQNSYTLSGLAPIPVIYDIITSGISNGSGLPVTIKARTIK